MAYNSKKNIIGMAAGAFSVAIYIVYVYTGNAPAQEDIQAWAKLLLIFIAISVAVQIGIQILFHVGYAVGIAVKEHDKNGEKTKKIVDASTIEDERDKLISLKTLRIGYTCAGIGLMAALFALACGASVVIVLHIIVGSSAAASFVEGCAGIFFHERGVRNGW